MDSTTVGIKDYIYQCAELLAYKGLGNPNDEDKKKQIASSLENK